MSCKQNVCILVIVWITLFLLNDAKRIKVISGSQSETTHPLQNKTGYLLPRKATNKTVTLVTNSTEADENNTSNQSRNTTQSHVMGKTTFGLALLVVFTLIIMAILLVAKKIVTFGSNSQNQEHNIEEMKATMIEDG